MIYEFLKFLAKICCLTENVDGRPLTSKSKALLGFALYARKMWLCVGRENYSSQELLLPIIFISWKDSFVTKIVGSLSNDDNDGNENIAKN